MPPKPDPSTTALDDYIKQNKGKFGRNAGRGGTKVSRGGRTPGRGAKPGIKTGGRGGRTAGKRGGGAGGAGRRAGMVGKMRSDAVAKSINNRRMANQKRLVSQQLLKRALTQRRSQLGVGRVGGGRMGGRLGGGLRGGVRGRRGRVSLGGRTPAQLNAIQTVLAALSPQRTPAKRRAGGRASLAAMRIAPASDVHSRLGIVRGQGRRGRNPRAQPVAQALGARKPKGRGVSGIMLADVVYQERQSAALRPFPSSPCMDWCKEVDLRELGRQQRALAAEAAAVRAQNQLIQRQRQQLARQNQMSFNRGLQMQLSPPRRQQQFLSPSFQGRQSFGRGGRGRSLGGLRMLDDARLEALTRSQGGFQSMGGGGGGLRMDDFGGRKRGRGQQSRNGPGVSGLNRNSFANNATGFTLNDRFGGGSQRVHVQSRGREFYY